MPENKITSPNQKVEVKFRVENSVRLDPANPIPPQIGGDFFYASSGKRYLPFLGKYDNWANLLAEARLASTTQNACITTIAESTVGSGLVVLDNQTPNADFLKWTGLVNNERQSLNELLVQAVDGERTYGNQFIEVIRGEVAGKRFLKVYLYSMLHCRLSEPDGDDISNSVFISRAFAKKGMLSSDKLDKAREIPLWSDNILDKVWVKNGDGTESTMIHLKNEVSSIEYYGMAASVPGISNQVLEAKYVRTNIDNLENNLILGGMLIFSSSMTQEEAQAQAKEILLSHVGEGKTGRIAVLSSEEGIKDVQFIPYNTSKEGSYIETDKHNTDKIIFANGWAKEFCFSDSGAMGKGGSYLRSLWDLKEAMLLKPLRNKVLSKVVAPIAKIYAEWMGASDVANYDFTFQSSMPFSFMADIKPEQFMKIKEARDLAGLEPDEKNGEKYLNEGKQNNKDVPPADPTA